MIDFSQLRGMKTIERWKKVSFYLAGISAWLTGQMGTGLMHGEITAEPVSPNSQPPLEVVVVN